MAGLQPMIVTEFCFLLSGQVQLLGDCPRVVKSCFNAYILFDLEYCAPVWMSSAESHLGLLDSVVRSKEISEDELFCLGHRKKVSSLCLLCKINHRVDHPMNEYLHHFVVARNTRVSAVLGELALVIPRYRTDHQSVVSACCWASVELAAVECV